MDKQEIRKYIKEKKREMSPREIELSSQKIAEALFSLPEYRASGVVLSYMSVNQEVKTGLIIGRSLEDGKITGIPKTFGSRRMDFYSFDPENLVPGPGSIPEPKGTERPVFSNGPSEKAVILVPGLAFDRNMNRIGYGGGYYDTFLEKYPGITKIALCHSFQLLDEIPAEQHDVKMDVIITSGEVLRR